MHIQVLSSGSEGNAALIRAGENRLLVDAGLPRPEMDARLASVLGAAPVDHVLVTHAHLDHARSAGWVARRARATLHAADSLLTRPFARRARTAVVRIGQCVEVERREGGDPVRVTAIAIPHDCDPTVAYRFEADGRVAVILTDVGHPCPIVARSLHDAHVLVLEFNHEPALMATSPYPPALQRRILGERGHLSNEQAAQMLGYLAGPNLHTLVLAHLSQRTNRPELALGAAAGALARLGAHGVRVVVASQREVGENLAV